LSNAPVDFVLMHPDGTLEQCRFSREHAPGEVLRELIPNLTSQGFGRLRLWFSADTTSMPANRLADQVIQGMGYRHHGGWHGPVALTMAREAGGLYPEMLPDALTAIEELAGTTAAAP
jgi:hypothetical protein